MRSVEAWRPTKFERHGAGVRASRDLAELAPASRMTAELVCDFYSRAIPGFARGSLLDLGCGKAPLYGLYRDHVGEVTLVDWSNSLHENPHLDLIQDLNDPLQLPSASFDTVLLSDVLEHIRNPGALMNEVARVLGDGGTLLMNVPFLYGLHEQPHDYYRYTRHALEHFTEAAGLELLELRAIGGYPEVVTDLTAKVAHRIPRVGTKLALALQVLARRLLRSAPGRKLSSKTREQWPLGYVLIARKPAATPGRADVRSRQAA